MFQAKAPSRLTGNVSLIKQWQSGTLLCSFVAAAVFFIGQYGVSRAGVAPVQRLALLAPFQRRGLLYG